MEIYFIVAILVLSYQTIWQYSDGSQYAVYLHKNSKKSENVADGTLNLRI